MSQMQTFEMSSIELEKEWPWLVNFSLNHSIAQGQTQFLK